MAVVFGFLNQIELAQQARAQLDFGGATSKAYLNDVARPENESALSDFERKLFRGNVPTKTCSQTQAFLAQPSQQTDLMQYSEFSRGCMFDAFGFHLAAGRWPRVPNEVVTSKDLPYKVGDILRGIAPLPLKVVGLTFNSNLTHSNALIAASGTWATWKMDAHVREFPKLTSSYILYFSTNKIGEARDRLNAMSQEINGASSVEVIDIHDPLRSAFEDFPFLYSWPIWPLALAAVATSLTFRLRNLGVSKFRLVENGLRERAVLITIILNTLAFLAAVIPAAGSIGWIMSFALEPLVAMSTGHAKSGANPFPFQEILIFELSLILVAVGIAFYFIFAPHKSPPQTTHVSKSVRTKGLSKKLKLATTAGGICALAASFSQIRTVNTAFALVFASVILLTWHSPELTRSIPRYLATRSLALTYASRRILRCDSKSWMAMAASIIAFGPFVALSILIASSASFANGNQLFPPTHGHALFYTSGSKTQDERVVGIISKASGGKSRITTIYTPVGRSGLGVVASSEGFGAVTVVNGVRDLEILLGRSIPKNTGTVLGNGGVIWVRRGLDARLWQITNAGTTPMETKGSAYMAVDRRWVNETAGFISTKTSKSLGLSNTLSAYSADGISKHVQVRIPALLIASGIDSNYITFWKRNTGVDVTPYETALGAILGFVGLVLTLVALKSSLDQLIDSSRNHVLLGIPYKWFGRVFAIETGIPALIGLLFGCLMPLIITWYAAQSLGIPLVIPLHVILGFALLQVVAYGSVWVFAYRRLGFGR